ncbi:MAG TPA: hypothetical protein VGB17_06295 [Pyrinomonadaceae bacterium]|jgi:hypothetical protein
MKTRLLKKIQQAILEHPAHFDMDEWGARYKLENLVHDEPPESNCNTTACIAGWACVLTNSHPTFEWKELPGFGLCVDDHEHHTGSLLGLNQKQVDRLFYTCFWPKRFEARYERAKKNTTKARIAAERIDHFIATKGAE